MEQPIIKVIKLTENQKNKLIRIKGITKIYQWNILCRWAFCYSLSRSGKLVNYYLPKNDVLSNVEISWKTFVGENHVAYAIALRQRLYNDGLELTDEMLREQFLLHLDRGINYISMDLKTGDSIGDFVNKIKG